MQKRKSAIELFTTFLQFDTEKAIGWVTDGSLRRNMLKSQAYLSQTENSEEFWVTYWYQQWQNNPKSLAKGHLSAYLQETCYWVANKIVKNFSLPQYTVSDCFQMTIGRIDKVLTGFKPEMGFSLKIYGSAIFRSEIKELLRQQQEIDICTDWGLLRKITQKRVVESLESIGMNSKIVERYVLAWKCYQTLYTPTSTGTRKLKQPSLKTWETIATFYNKERLIELPPNTPECSAEIMERWMLAAAKAVRNYSYPTSISLNAPRGNRDNSRELIDDFLEYQQTSPISQIIAREEQLQRQALWDRISAVLLGAIEGLDEESRKIINMYYTCNMSQKEIAQKLKVKQYNISRHLSRIRKTLLLKLAIYCQESLNISLEPSVLDCTSILMKEWLQNEFNS